MTTVCTFVSKAGFGLSMALFFVNAALGDALNCAVSLGAALLFYLSVRIEAL